MAQGVEHKAHNNRLSLKFLIYLVSTGHLLKPEDAFPSPGEKVYIPHTY